MENESNIPEEEKISLSEIDFSEMVDEVDNYNAKFSTGRLMAEAVRGGRIKGEEVDQKSKLNLIKANKEFGPLMNRVGLNIELAETGTAIFTSDGKAGISEIRFNIANREKFIGYLQEIGPESITENQIKGLKAVLENVTLQLEKQYQIDNPNDDRMVELLGGLDEIIKGCERLDPENSIGIDESIEKLKKYNEAKKNKSLREFIVAEREGLFLEVGGRNFGPSTWHMDANPDYYEEKWAKALKVLSSIKESNKSGEFYKKLKDHLIDSAKYAIDDLEKKIKAGDRIDYYQPLMEIIDNYYDELQSA